MGEGRSWCEADRQLDPERPLAVFVPMEEIALHDRDCSISREEYGSSHGDQEAETPALLSCGHVFGNLCLKPWFEEQRSCPLCRRDYSDEFPGAIV